MTTGFVVMVVAVQVHALAVLSLTLPLTTTLHVPVALCSVASVMVVQDHALATVSLALIDPMVQYVDCEIL